MEDNSISPEKSK
jgi:hypothetical protein